VCRQNGEYIGTFVFMTSQPQLNEVCSQYYTEMSMNNGVDIALGMFVQLPGGKRFGRVSALWEQQNPNGSTGKFVEVEQLRKPSPLLSYHGPMLVPQKKKNQKKKAKKFILFRNQGSSGHGGQL
jgi:hypothetical protein